MSKIITMHYIDLFGVCAFDDKNDRILDGYFETSDKMTIELCLSTCRSKGFKYSGLEWQCECHCGNEPELGFEWTWSSKCNEICSGDSSQICGGSSAMSVWKTPPKDLNGICIYDFPSRQRVFDDFSLTGLQNLTKANCEKICAGKKSNIFVK